MKKASSRNIVALVGFATLFSVVGEERQAGAKLISSGGSQNTTVATQGVILTPARTILGGALAGTLLLALSMAGEVAEQFAQGLAMVTAASAVIFFGQEVFGLVLSLEGTPAASKVLTPAQTSAVSASKTPVVSANGSYTSPYDNYKLYTSHAGG